MAKHRPARNPFRWIPALTLTGLAFLGGISVSAYSSPHTTLSSRVSAPAPVPFTKPVPVIMTPQKAAQAPPAAVVSRYTVRSGDSLWKIAVAHCGTGTDDAALAKANHIGIFSVISPGEVITLSC